MLINEREDELNNQIEKTVLEYLELKKDLELLKSNKGEEITKKMRKIYHENQIKKREDEIKHKNWLTEREKRISQLKLLRGNQLTQKQAKINSSITIESENVKTLDEKEKIIPITEKSVTSNISESITNVQATVSNSVDLSISSPKTVKIQEEQTEDSKDNIDQIDLNKEENISNNTELDKNNTTDETSVNLDNEATTEESTSETYESVVEEQVFQNEIKTEDEPIVEENITTLEPEAVESIECVNETDNAIKNDQPVTEVVIEQEASNDSKVSNPADYPSDTPSDNRRKKKKYLKNKPNIPTRSTRSQTLVKTEMETKETPIKLETTKVNSKKRSTSIEESSAYTMSEESNGPKTPLSAPNQNEVDNGWREVGLEILHSLLNHRHISFLETKISTELKPRDDLSVIQRQVETGQVKTFDELRKALMFFFFNLNMLNTDKSKSDKFMELEKFVLNKIDQNEHNKFEKSEVIKSLHNLMINVIIIFIV